MENVPNVKYFKEVVTSDKKVCLLSSYGCFTCTETVI